MKQDFWVRRGLQITLACLLLGLTACSSKVNGSGGDGGASDSAQGDAANSDMISPDTGDGPVGCAACTASQVCFQNSCVENLGSCTEDKDCQQDSFCEQGTCIPYGPTTKQNNDQCLGAGFVAEAFADPVVACSWTDNGAVTTPIVADLDGDGNPEIVFHGHVSGQAGYRSLVAIRGDNCQPLFVKSNQNLMRYSNLAIGDLTGDGVVEIVGIRDDRVVVFDNMGNELYQSAVDVALNTGSGAGSIIGRLGGPALANLDQQGVPEIVYAGAAFRIENGQLITLFNNPVDSAYWGHVSVVADVDLDGTPDIVAGNRIFDGITGADKTPSNIALLGAAYPAIVQWDPTTPEPEIVIVTSDQGTVANLIVYHPVTGQIVFGPYPFGQQYGGPPTVADFDGDGQPEIAAAGYLGYAVFDQECAVSPVPAFCDSDGVRWLKQTKDFTSGSTGSSVFDFNGDGAAEVVYRDECWLRVYDGATGATKAAIFTTSITALEIPVVADVDVDGHADLVVSANSYSGGCQPEADLGLPVGSPIQGVFVLKDPMNRWMPSRPIWNQHSYHITNINDNGTVPQTETNSWTGLNNYRQNVQGTITSMEPLPDLTGGFLSTPECNGPNGSWVLNANVCNRGAETTTGPVSGTFYEGDPRSGGTAICTAQTTGALAKGQCEMVSCQYTNPPTTSDLWFQADQTGTAQTEVECLEENNLLHFPAFNCAPIE